MDELIATVKANLPKGTENLPNREKLRAAAYRLALALETPEETVWRIGLYPMQTTIVRIGNKLDLFGTLDRSNVPMSVQDLANVVTADPQLLLRLLRYLAAMGAIEEVDENQYTANNITRNLAVPRLAAGLNYCHDVVGRCISALPSFLSESSYRNPTDPTHCPFQEGFQTSEVFFGWFPKQPEQFNDFTLWMTAQRQGRPTWLDFYPVEENLGTGSRASNDTDSVTLVDVGGGIGHEIEQIRNRYPTLGGRFILQDLPDTLKQALSLPGLEVMPHDFLEPQPIKGARVYYLRSILHDWPDSKSRVILSHLAAAMTKDHSKILINELVVSNRGAGLHPTQLDLSMMVCLAGMERSEGQWQELARSVGLKIESIWTADPNTESILELVLA